MTDLQPLNAPEEEIIAAPLDEIREWEAKFREARSKRKYWQEVEDEAKEMITDYLGDAEFGSVGGQITLRWRRMEVGRFNTKKFRKQSPELAEEFTDVREERRMEVIEDD